MTADEEAFACDGCPGVIGGEIDNGEGAGWQGDIEDDNKAMMMTQSLEANLCILLHSRGFRVC